MCLEVRPEILCSHLFIILTEGVNSSWSHFGKTILLSAKDGSNIQRSKVTNRNDQQEKYSTDKHIKLWKNLVNYQNRSRNMIIKNSGETKPGKFWNVVL